MSAEASPVRKPRTSAAAAGEPEGGEEGGTKRGVLDKRPSYAERFSCLIGMEGSRGAF